MSKELVKRLRFSAEADYQANHMAGRRGKQWDIASELDWQAADEIERLNGIIGEAIESCHLLRYSTEQFMSDPPLNVAAYCALHILSQAHKVKE